MVIMETKFKVVREVNQKSALDVMKEGCIVSNIDNPTKYKITGDGIIEFFDVNSQEWKVSGISRCHFDCANYTILEEIPDYSNLPKNTPVWVWDDLPDQAFLMAFIKVDEDNRFVVVRDGRHSGYSSSCVIYKNMSLTHPVYG